MPLPDVNPCIVYVVGLVLLVLGVMHFGNLYIFTRVRGSLQDKIDRRQRFGSTLGSHLPVATAASPAGHEAPPPPTAT